MQEKEEEGRKRGRGGGGECLTFFKGIINSLSALVYFCNANAEVAITSSY